MSQELLAGLLLIVGDQGCLVSAEQMQPYLV